MLIFNEFGRSSRIIENKFEHGMRVRITTILVVSHVLKH